MEEKRKEVAISTKSSKFAAWFDNYWYHYKWATIIGLFFSIVVIVCIAQSCTLERYDLMVSYAGNYLEEEDKASIEFVLSSSLPDGFAEQESPKCEFNSYLVLTKDQILEMEKETDADGNKVYVDSAFISSEQQTLINQIKTGQTSIYFIDIEVYNSLFLNDDGTSDILMPLKDIFGETPNGSCDNYGILLGDTAMYKEYRGIRALPEDTVICLAKKLYHQSEDSYSLQVEAFKAFAKN